MAEVIKKIQVIITYEIGGVPKVLSAYEVGSDTPGDTRTRNGAETQRDITNAEMIGSLDEFLNGLVSRAETDAGI